MTSSFETVARALLAAWDKSDGMDPRYPVESADVANHMRALADALAHASLLQRRVLVECARCEFAKTIGRVPPARHSDRRRSKSHARPGGSVSGAWPSCADCGTALNAGEAATFTVCDGCWTKVYGERLGLGDALTALEVKLGACTESRRLIIELACSELEACANAFAACHNAGVVLGSRYCGCGTADRSVRAVISRLREQTGERG